MSFNFDLIFSDRTIAYYPTVNNFVLNKLQELVLVKIVNDLLYTMYLNGINYYIARE